jgi:hypothetical protein
MDEEKSRQKMPGLKINNALTKIYSERMTKAQLFIGIHRAPFDLIFRKVGRGHAGFGVFSQNFS